MANNDYTGNDFTMESFTAQTTDGSGDITVSLSNTPIADDSIIVQLQGVSGAFAEFKTRTGASLTVKVRSKYERTDDTAGGTVTGLPASVTADTTVGGPIITSATQNSGVADDGQNSGTGATSDHAHNVTINKISNIVK